MSSQMNGYPVNDDEPLLNANNVHRPVRHGVNKKRCPKCCLPCCMVSMCISMVICAIVAIGLGLSYDFINRQVDSFIAQEVALTNGSKATETWANPGAPVLMSFYLFNLTNKDDFLRGKRPKLEEIGPFVYNENKTKHDFVWNADETILEYKESITYTYNKALSKFDPSVQINTINLPLMGILVQFEKLITMYPSLHTVLNVLEEQIKNEFNENLIMTRSMDEIVWGYNDSFLAFIRDLNISFINDAIPPGGFFSLEKRSKVVDFNMVYTGKGYSRFTAKYIMYNGKTSIDGWGSPYAKMINGTEALLFHPGVDRSEELEIYVDELFRSGYFSYVEDVVEYGIVLYKFILPQKELNGATQDKGFYMNGPDGVLNLTAVFPLNTPIFVSKPRFLDADHVYLENITIPEPNSTLHDSFLCVEPLTGAVLDAAKRLQINIQIREYDLVKELSHLRPMTYFPIMWVEEAGKLNSTLATTFKQQVYLPKAIVSYGVIAVFSFGGFMAVVCCLLFSSFLICWCKPKRENLSVQFNNH